MTENKCRFTPFLKQCFVTTTVGINLVGQGALLGFPAVLLPQFYQPDSDIVSSKTIDSWIASMLAVTLFFGSFMVTPILNRYGRKMGNYVISAGSVLGWGITVLAGSVEVVLFARVISGISFGMMMPLRSILIGEYTSPKNRGGFLTTISLTQGVGIFFVHLIGSFMSWRKTALVCLFLPMTSFIMTIFIPESPSWFVFKGRYDECRQAFHWIRGNEEDEELEAMIQARINFTASNQKKLDIIGSIKKKEFYKPIILMLHVYALTQLSGAAVTATYSTTIIKLIMNPTVNAHAWMIVLDTERIIMNTLAIFIINKVKRRAMVLSTLGICIFSLLAISGYVSLRNNDILTYDILWIPGSLMVLQFFTISVGMVPLPSVIAGEVFPLEYKSIAGSLSIVSISVNMFLVQKTFPALVDSIGLEGTYTVYAGILIYCMFVIWFLLPETKGRTLQDIEDEYRGKAKVKNVEEVQSLDDEKNSTQESKNENSL